MSCLTTSSAIPDNRRTDTGRVHSGPEGGSARRSPWVRPTARDNACHALSLLSGVTPRLRARSGRLRRPDCLLLGLVASRLAQVADNERFVFWWLCALFVGLSSENFNRSRGIPSQNRASADGFVTRFPARLPRDARRRDGARVATTGHEWTSVHRRQPCAHGPIEVGPSGWARVFSRASPSA